MNEIHQIILKYYVPPLSATEQKVAWFCTVARIGSLRYIAWLSASFTLITGLFCSVLYFLEEHSSLTHHVLYFINRGLFIVYLFLLGAVCTYISMKRLQDFNANKWWGLIMFLPVINVLMFIVLILIPSNKTNNKFGEPPSATTKLEWLLVGWFCLMASGVLWGVILIYSWLSFDENTIKGMARQEVSYISTYHKV